MRPLISCAELARRRTATQEAWVFHGMEPEQHSRGSMLKECTCENDD